MPTHVALLRGINVGGNNLLPTRELVPHFEALGCECVRTYLQSGNVVFSTSITLSATFGETLAERIEASHGFRPHVLVLTAAQFLQAVRANPFPEAAVAPATLHLFFLASLPAEADWDGMERLRADSERCKLVERFFYLHAPAGIGRSRLAAGAERLLGVPATARNWRTVEKLAEMLAGP